MASITVTPWGQTSHGQPIELFRLTTEGGLVAELTNYGATLVALHLPDRQGRLADVVLGFPSLEGYLGDHPFYGTTVGRFANRIAHGRFSIGTTTYKLGCNEDGFPNCLHGGGSDFRHQAWQSSSSSTLEAARVKFSHFSPDGAGGFPGNLKFSVTYSLTEKGALDLHYRATVDQPTHLNTTNHTYFNLAGPDATSIHDHTLSVAANHYTPCNAENHPAGAILPLAGTGLDLRRETLLGDVLLADCAEITRFHGLDHNFVLHAGDSLSTPVARLHHPPSGRTLTVYTSEPAIQVYAGNSLGEATQPLKNGQTPRKHQAICLETQHFPNSPNVPHFPSTLLQPGEVFASHTRFVFSTQ